MAILTLKATQQCVVEASVKDSRGNPATVQGPQWVSLEEATVTVVPDATNPLKATVKAVGPVDEASQIQFTADADTGEGVKPLIALLDVVVTGGDAVIIELVAGTPTEQP